MTPEEELGTLALVREVLQLSEGSVINTARSAGENIDIYIGGMLGGYGEIVVIENALGVRITDFREPE